MSLSSERRRYSSGGGLPGALFGIVFTASGLFVLCALGWTVLELFGIVQSQENPDRSIGEYVLCIFALLAIGGGHLAGGTVLLWTLRTTLDRARDLVVVRSGWLGCRCRRRRLSEFQSVAVLPGRHLSDPELFDIALLNDTTGESLIVGYVSRSYDLALSFADEISEFTKMPAATSRAAAAGFRNVRADDA